MPIHTGAGAHGLLTGDIIVRILRTIFRDFVATFYSNFPIFMSWLPYLYSHDRVLVAAA